MFGRLVLDPIDVILEAPRSLIGRIIMVALAYVVGCGLGGLLVTGDMIGVAAGVIGSISIALGSILASYGLMVMPMIFGFTYFYIRFEWSEKSLVVPMLLAAFLSYDMIGDAIERERRMREMVEEAAARAMEQVEQEVEESNDTD